MKTWFAIVTLAIISTLGVGQDKDSSPSMRQEPTGAAIQRAPARDSYRLEYTITELEDGKKLNARSFAVLCEDRGNPTRGVLKVGSRIPVMTSGEAGKPAEVQYLDVGMNIDARLDLTASGDLSLQSDFEMSSVAEDSASHSGTLPVIRQFRITSFNAVIPGKPVIIATADDVTTHRQYQIQLTAMKLK